MLLPKPLMFRVDQSAGRRSCWPWTGCIEKSGYGRVRRNGKSTLSHRAIYEEFVGPIPGGMDVLHRCDNKACCNPTHLFVGTHQDNMTDMVIKGRTNAPKGERNANAVINASAAKEIKTRLKNNEACTVIAEALHISVHPVYSIKYGKSWRHVQ